MEHKDIALKFFGEKFHCSQAVIAAFAPECGITEERALKLGACFGSGMRKGAVCGACTGALMVLGLLYGHNNIDDLESRQIANNVNDRMMQLFTVFCPRIVENAVDILEKIIREQNDNILK